MAGKTREQFLLEFSEHYLSNDELALKQFLAENDRYVYWLHEAWMRTMPDDQTTPINSKDPETPPSTEVPAGESWLAKLIREAMESSKAVKATIEKIQDKSK